jgi:predicted DNA-binding transcriptional regulator AlpA
MARTLRAIRAGAPATVTVPDPDLAPADELAALVVLLAALQTRAAARLLERPADAPPDRLLDAEEAAARLRTSVDWLWGRVDLPFRVELSPKQIRYSERGLAAWIAARLEGGT